MEVIHAASAASVARLAGDLVGVEAIAFDTEFLWERSYFPRLCLIQVASDDLLATVDPLAVDDLGALWETLVAAPVVLLHAAAHDLDILHRATGRLPAQVFDSQIAAAFLGFGDAVGYEALVGRVLQRRLMGGEGYTDWSRRPLTDRQVDYALDDVRHLHDLWRALSVELERRGRSEWVADEIRHRFADVGRPIDPLDQWRRVKDARKLRGRALAVLQQAAAWREREAMAADENRQRVVPDRVLIEVARREATDPGQIARMRGLHPGQAKRFADPLAGAVRRALEVPKADWPRWPEKPDMAADPRVDVFASLLDAVVRSRASDLRLAPRLLGTRSDLEEMARRHLAGEGLQDVPLLEGWRKHAVGGDLIAVLRGDAAVRIVPAPGGPTLDVG
jgi:ribonuclease D